MREIHEDLILFFSSDFKIQDIYQSTSRELWFLYLEVEKSGVKVHNSVLI